MKKRQKKNQPKNRLNKNVDKKLPFIEHLRELRRRLFYISVSIVGFTLAAYAVQQRLVRVLLAPTHGQHFIYTSPAGGLNFLFRVCLYTGIAISIPVIVYQLLRYIQPLIKDQRATRFIVLGSLVSAIFAFIGMTFGYYIGLPAVLHFLFHQFKTSQVQPLITIQSYIAFITYYMLGSALLLQVPLLIIFINRVKPLKPTTLLHYERWVIVGAFIVAAVMNPTPDLLSLAMVACPVILMYQVSILIVWLTNRRRIPSQRIAALIAQDIEAREARLRIAQTSQLYELPSLLSKPAALSQPSLSPQLDPQPAAEPLNRSRPPVQRRLYFSDIRPNYGRNAELKIS